MPVIRCEVCRGVGKIEVVKFELDALGKMFAPPKGMIGMSTETLRVLERHTHAVKHQVTCSNCGGSGCKWSEGLELYSEVDKDQMESDI